MYIYIVYKVHNNIYTPCIFSFLRVSKARASTIVSGVNISFEIPKLVKYLTLKVLRFLVSLSDYQPFSETTRQNFADRPWLEGTRLDHFSPTMLHRWFTGDVITHFVPLTHAIYRRLALEFPCNKSCKPNH